MVDAWGETVKKGWDDLSFRSPRRLCISMIYDSISRINENPQNWPDFENVVSVTIVFTLRVTMKHEDENNRKEGKNIPVLLLEHSGHSSYKSTVFYRTIASVETFHWKRSYDDISLIFWMSSGVRATLSPFVPPYLPHYLRSCQLACHVWWVRKTTMEKQRSNNKVCSATMSWC